jgi:hypothetical protein
MVGMSLDVYLQSPEEREKFCPHCCNTSPYRDTFYERNITHNLAQMAEEAGIYKHLWRPDEIGITQASQLIEPLREGLDKLKCFPERFKPFNPENGWGDYEGLLDFVSEYLRACIQYPDAIAKVSR